MRTVYSFRGKAAACKDICFSLRNSPASFPKLTNQKMPFSRYRPLNSPGTGENQTRNQYGSVCLLNPLLPYDPSKSSPTHFSTSSRNRNFKQFRFQHTVLSPIFHSQVPSHRRNDSQELPRRCDDHRLWRLSDCHCFPEC